jgi:hypothetical protein
VVKDINYQVAAAMRQSFGKIDVVTLPAIRKCYICKKTNAVRQCGPGVSLSNTD